MDMIWYCIQYAGLSSGAASTEWRPQTSCNVGNTESYRDADAGKKKKERKHFSWCAMSFYSPGNTQPVYCQR